MLSILQQQLTNKQKWLLPTLVILMFWLCNYFFLTEMVSNSNRFLRISLTGIQPVRVSEMERWTTDSGLEILVPKHDDQSWDASLPCIPRSRFNERIRLRKSSLRSGFSVQNQ